MLNIIPDKEILTNLIGRQLYYVWIELCALVNEKYDMECLWNKAVKPGNTNVNFAEAVKLYAHYMQEKIALAL